MISRSTISFLFLLLLAFNAVKSQTNDAQLWLSTEIEKKLNPRLSLHVAEELRMNENITEAGTVFSDFGMSIDVSRGLNASAHYRFINKRRLDNTYDNRHRYYFDLTYKYDPKPLIFSLRARFQSQYTDLLTSEDGKIPEYYERTRLKIACDAGRKFRPYLSAEVFLPLSGRVSSLIIDCIRYQAGIEYKFNRYHSLNAFYMVQTEINVADPQNYFVTGLGYSFVF